MSETIDLTESAPRRRLWQVLGIWTGATLVYAIVMRSQIHLPFRYALVSSAVYYYSLAGFMILVGRWSKRLNARRLPAATVFMHHLLTGAVVVLLWQLVNLIYIRLAVGPGFWELTYANNWMFQLVTGATTYGTALGLTLAFHASDRESDLLILARDSELAAIKAQMQPHFILNVLNSVLVLIEKDPALAKLMVTRLSDLMRAVFEQFEVVQIPLRREIDLTKAYLDIERIRFGPRLSVSLNIDEAAAKSIVPAFLLQPIVENAIKHGIGQLTGPTELNISGLVHGKRLSLAVTNSRKPGIMGDLEALSHVGRGLQLTRRRLAATYGDDHAIRFESSDSTVTVKLDLPAQSYDHQTSAAASR